MTTSSIAVVGGGLAGLLAARTLARAGAQVTVLDGAGTGGALARRRLDDLDLDVGAEGFATRGGAVGALLEELGLADRVVAPRPTGTWVYRPGGSTRIPDGAVLGIPTDLSETAHEQLDQLGHDEAARARADLTLPPSVGADAQTLGALVRTRMGDAVAHAWLRPLVAGVHRLDIDDIAPGLLLPGVLDRLAERGSLAAALAGGGAPVAGLAGGITQLADALAGELVTLGCRMLPVAADAVERGSHGWRVRTGDGRTVAAGRLLLAAPPWNWPTGLGGALAVAARGWPEPRPVDLVTLVLSSDGGGRRAGVVVADGGDRVGARALTYSSAKWGWLAEAAGERAVLRLTYDAVDLDDAALMARALDDAAILTGASWGPTDLRAADRTRWLMPRSAVDPGMAQQRAGIREALAETEGIEAAGGWLSGSGLAWVAADAPAAAARLLVG